MEEWLPLINEQGDTIGKATRAECHTNNTLLHPVVHLHVINSKGKILLQKRPSHKITQPGKWDTAVGGHVDLAEDIHTALLRETKEELGITDFTPIFIGNYLWKTFQESEMAYTYYTLYDGPFSFNPTELDEIAFWSVEDIKKNIGKNIFTPNFEGEFKLLLEKDIIPNLF